MFTARAKLFRFIKETKENKERGVGDLKVAICRCCLRQEVISGIPATAIFQILRNPKTNAYRVVMRREQVHKVCANFAILPTIELNEKKGMPNVYNWICRVGFTTSLLHLVSSVARSLVRVTVVFRTTRSRLTE